MRSGSPPQSIAASESPSFPLSKPCAFLYEPDPAVIRAQAHITLAASLGAAFLATDIAYLTADTWIKTPFATAYRVLDWMPYNLKVMQTWLRSHSARHVAIKKRGVPFTPEYSRSKNQSFYC